MIQNLVWNVLNRPGLSDIIDILVVTVIIYELLMLTRQTRGSAVLKGLLLLLLIVGGVGGATVTMLPSVAASALIGWQTAHGGQRSPYGDEVIGQTLGFRRFLHNATDRHVVQMLRRDPQYFYKILPYAEAMGQGRHFVALFHDCRLEPCQWYDSARGIPNTASAFYDHYADTLDMLNLSIRK